MHRYFFRICWYVGLMLVTVGFSLLPIPKIMPVVLVALAWYVPLSLLWVLLTPLLVHVESAVQQPSELPGFIAMLVGALMAGTYYCFPNADLASFAVLTMLLGGDWVFFSREQKSLLEHKLKQH